VASPGTGGARRTGAVAVAPELRRPERPDGGRRGAARLRAAVSGVLRVPAILLKFKDTPAAELRTTTQYNQVLFAASPTGASAGRPYTYRSYYEQLSNGLLSVQGQTYGYAALDSNEITYTGGSNCTGNPYGSSNCNGLFHNSDLVSPVTRMQNGLREALRKLDTQVDWTQYDFDGDSYVDLVAFIHPAVDGACGGATNNHLWSNHSYVPYTTHSVNSQGVPIKVADYILESGVGGLDGCDPSQIMPVGTVVHETGAAFPTWATHAGREAVLALRLPDGTPAFVPRPGDCETTAKS